MYFHSIYQQTQILRLGVEFVFLLLQQNNNINNNNNNNYKNNNYKNNHNYSMREVDRGRRALLNISKEGDRWVEIWKNLIFQWADS